MAVVFDCDGTLVDSEPLARLAWERALAPHGYTPTGEDFELVTGLPFPRVHEYFAERAPLPGEKAFHRAYLEDLYELFAAKLRPFADAAAAIAALRARGIPIAVASSSTRERLELALRLTGYDDFPVMVAGDEVARGKPAPDMFLAAAERLGVAPAACVAVEDSAPGVAAARAAGMATLAVCRVPGTEAALADADRVVGALTADAILELLSDRAAPRST